LLVLEKEAVCVNAWGEDYEMSVSVEGFEQLVSQSKKLADALKYDPPPINHVQRAKLVFQLRLAYNFTVRQCDDQFLTRRLLGLIEECEELLES